AGTEETRRVRISSWRRGDPGRNPAGVVQDSVVQMLPGCRGERADSAPSGDEGRHGKRGGDDQGPVAEIQPRPTSADHEGNLRNHRRGGGTEIKNPKKIGPQIYRD